QRHRLRVGHGQAFHEHRLQWPGFAAAVKVGDDAARPANPGAGARDLPVAAAVPLHKDAHVKDAPPPAGEVDPGLDEPRLARAEQQMLYDGAKMGGAAPVDAGLGVGVAVGVSAAPVDADDPDRSEEHTSELQSREKLVCRLLLE